MFLVNSRPGSFAAASTYLINQKQKQSLSRSYGCYFAEFLNASFPETPESTRLDHQCWFAVRSKIFLASEAFLVRLGHLTHLPSRESIWHRVLTPPTDLPIGVNISTLAPEFINRLKLPCGVPPRLNSLLRTSP